MYITDNRSPKAHNQHRWRPTWALGGGATMRGSQQKGRPKGRQKVKAAGRLNVQFQEREKGGDT
jgi:hypothetical protein